MSNRLMRTHQTRSTFRGLPEIGGTYGACSPVQGHTRAPDLGASFATRHDDSRWLYLGRQRTHPIKRKLYARAYLGYAALRPASIVPGQKTHRVEKCTVGMGQETVCTAANKHSLKGLRRLTLREDSGNEKQQILFVQSRRYSIAIAAFGLCTSGRFVDANNFLKDT